MRLEDMTVEGAAHGSVAVSGGTASFRSDGKTDWFFSPAGAARMANVPRLVWETAEPVFSLSAKVSVDFASAYDAGALFIEADEENWAKVAFEYSADQLPTIVSVVTRSTSDDSDGPKFSGAFVYLRIYCDGKTSALHFSEDGKFWKFLRWFTITGLDERPIKIGLGAQSPTGTGVTATFSDVELNFDVIADLRNGQ
ncbi:MULTISPECIES: DUF1349 domain-containing protein [unclassified Mesorhizobium]|uniref:DUF1349 domain-containing protein n=1 Tax=unclassified Mesorhizobium TaxID=325217 RepID=UPI001FD96DBB|nr:MULTISPECIES: DUF1349 domain-containing protein [unclassified Mesorhizobium]